MLIDHLGLYKILTYKYVQMQNVGSEWYVPDKSPNLVILY